MSRELQEQEIEFLNTIKESDGYLPGSQNMKKVGFDFIYGEYFYLNKHKTSGQISYLKDKESFKKLLKEQISYLLIDNFFFNCICDALKGVRIVFNPHEGAEYEEHGDRFFNTFSTAGSKLYLRNLIKGRVERKEVSRHGIEFLKKFPFINLLLKNIMNNNEEHIEYFINWLSTALNELDKNMTAIALVGAEEGTGKGVLENFILSHIYGNLLATMSNSELNSDFNTLTDEKMFLVLNEIKADLKDSKMVAEKLKMMITDKFTAINRKFKDTVIKRNYYNIILFSNEALPVKISETDRRWTVFNTSSIKLKDLSEEIGYTIHQFLEKIKEERDAFIVDLFLFDYSKTKALSVLSTELKEIITENTSTKLEVLVSKIRKKDINWIEERLEETVSSTFTRNSLKQEVNNIKEEFNESLISNNTLCFLYKKLIDLENLTDYKISQKFTQYLGSANISKRGKRYRNLKDSKEMLLNIKEGFNIKFDKTEKEMENVIKENVKDFIEDTEVELNLIDFVEKTEEDKIVTVYDKKVENGIKYYYLKNNKNYFTIINEEELTKEEQKTFKKLEDLIIPF